MCIVVPTDDASLNYIHYKAKTMWTPDHHSHMCLLNIPFQSWYPLYCYNSLQSSEKAFK